MPSHAATASRPRAASSWFAAPNRAPDLCVAGHAEGNAEDDGDSGGNVRIGEDLACAGHILDALAGLHPEFLEHVAGKTGSGVKRGQAECGDCQDQQRVGDLLCAGAEQSAEHGGQAACENCGGNNGGAVGVIASDVRNCAQEMIARADSMSMPP